jgi:hypothetical protein
VFRFGKSAEVLRSRCGLSLPRLNCEHALVACRTVRRGAHAAGRTGRCGTTPRRRIHFRFTASPTNLRIAAFWLSAFGAKGNDEKGHDKLEQLWTQQAAPSSVPDIVSQCRPPYGRTIIRQHRSETHHASYPASTRKQQITAENQQNKRMLRAGMLFAKRAERLGRMHSSSIVMK